MPDNPPPDQAASNSLGLDLDALKLKDDPEPAAPKPPPADGTSPSEDTPTSPTDAADTKTEGDDKDAAGKKEPKEKKKPYVNPDRVKTGGQREKPSEEELAERMARIREQNEKIKQRRLDVQADEDEYKKMQEVERVKVAKAKKVQESVDKAREQNARRKMDKIQSREWDSGKPSREWNKPKRADEETDDAEKKAQPSIGIRGGVRGGGRGGGRGRGRGGGGGVTSPAAERGEKKDAPGAETPSAPAETVAASS